MPPRPTCSSAMILLHMLCDSCVISALSSVRGVGSCRSASAGRPKHTLSQASTSFMWGTRSVGYTAQAATHTRHDTTPGDAVRTPATPTTWVGAGTCVLCGNHNHCQLADKSMRAPHHTGSKSPGVVPASLAQLRACFITALSSLCGPHLAARMPAAPAAAAAGSLTQTAAPSSCWVWPSLVRQGWPRAQAAAQTQGCCGRAAAQGQAPHAPPDQVAAPHTTGANTTTQHTVKSRLAVS